MSDIIERLRKRAPHWNVTDAAIMKDAADEIARLRAEVARLEADAARSHEQMAWIEARVREGTKLEIARSLYGSGFEFGFWPSHGGIAAKVYAGKTLAQAVRAAIDAARAGGTK